MSEKQEKLGALPYIVGGISFIPAIGILFGIISIVWGLVTKKSGGKTLAIIGASGIGFSIIIYGALFYFSFVQKGGIYDELRAQLAKSTLTSLVQAIEFYKVQNGHYPDSLKTLKNSQPKNAMVFVFDPTQVKIGGKPHYFYYKLKDPSHYYLLGVGPDGKPFTSDDILPDIKAMPNSSIGLLIYKGSKNGQ